MTHTPTEIKFLKLAMMAWQPSTQPAMSPVQLARELERYLRELKVENHPDAHPGDAEAAARLGRASDLFYAATAYLGAPTQLSKTTLQRKLALYAPETPKPTGRAQAPPPRRQNGQHGQAHDSATVGVAHCFLTLASYATAWTAFWALLSALLAFQAELGRILE